MPDETPIPPVVEKTTTEHVKASTEAGAATLLNPPPMTAADDKIRKTIAGMDAMVFLVLVGGICAYLIYHQGSVGTDVLAVLIMVIQAMISVIQTERQYYFGSSSGSTSKSLAAGGK